MKNEGGSRRPGRGSRSPAREREEGALEGPGVGAAGVKRHATAFESRQSLTRVCTGHNLIGFLQETERERERDDNGKCRRSLQFLLAAGVLRHLIYSSVRLASGPVSDATPSSLLSLEQVFLVRKKKKTRLKPHTTPQPFLSK